MALGRTSYWVSFVLPVVLGWIIAPALGLVALGWAVLVAALACVLPAYRPSADRRAS